MTSTTHDKVGRDKIGRDEGGGKRDDGGDPAFYRAIVEAVPEAIIVATQEGKITYFNPACERLLGYAAADVVGHNIAMLVPPQPDRRVDAMKWLERWAHETSDAQSRFLDLIAQTRAGALMPVDVRVVENEFAGARRFLITFRDNTQRRKEHTAFKEANLRASRILQIAEDGIVSADAAQTIIFFNLKAEEMFGYRAEDVIGRPLAMLMPERLRGRHRGDVERFSAGREASRAMNARGEVVGLRRNGEEFPLEVAITKVSIGGTITFTAHMRDVTERKRAEERLKESERRFRVIFDHAFEAIGLIALDGTVLEINRAGRLLTEGQSPLIGLPLWDLPWVGSDMAQDDSARQRLKAAVAEAAGGARVHYTANLAPQGTPTRDIDITLTPVRDENGRVVYIVPEGHIAGA